VDGHNLIFQVRELAELQTRGRKREAREALLRRLRAFSQRRGARAIVVFDGTDAGVEPRPAGGVEVEYASGPGGADDRIVALAERVAASGAPLRVVTRDRSLRDRLPARTRTEDPETFWNDAIPRPRRSRASPPDPDEKTGFRDPEIEEHFLAREREMREAAREAARPPRKRPPPTRSR
jgi:hypothetical protein